MGWTHLSLFWESTTEVGTKKPWQQVVAPMPVTWRCGLLSQQYDFIFSFMPTFFFLVYFTLSHVTLLSHGSHVQSHDGSPDLSHDKGTWSVTWPWTIFTSHMSHYDSLLCVSPILSLWLTLPNLWLQWMFQTIHRTYWLILPHHPYSMMSLTTCTLLFLVHSQ